MAHDDQQNTTSSPTLGDDLAQMSENFTQKPIQMNEYHLCMTGRHALYLRSENTHWCISGGPIDAPLWIASGSHEQCDSICNDSDKYTTQTMTTRGRNAEPENLNFDEWEPDMTHPANNPELMKLPEQMRRYDYGTGFPILMHVYFKDLEWGIDLWMLDAKPGYTIFAWAYPDYEHMEMDQGYWRDFHLATCHTLEENKGAAWINTDKIEAMYPTSAESDDLLQPPAPFHNTQGK